MVYYLYSITSQKWTHSLKTHRDVNALKHIKPIKRFKTFNINS